MERIVVLMQPNAIDRGLLDFACYLSNLTNSMLTTLFLHPVEEGAADTALAGMPLAGQVSIPVHARRESAAHSGSVDAKKEFLSLCENRGLRWMPEIIDVFALDEVLLESRFADLFVIGADLSWSNEAQPVPTTLVEDILRKSESPVIVAPLHFDGVEEIVFAYDGTASSVYAIKQFTHLFPQLQDQGVTFLEVSEDNTRTIEYKEKITDYLKMHFSSIGYKVLTGQPENKLYSYFLGKEKVMVVMGAFGKKAVPSFFRHSTANLFLKTTSLPLFVAHR